MKNITIYVLIFGASILYSSFTFGQKRSIDLRVQITSPLKGSTLKSPGNVTIKFFAFNKGPDNINTNDTFVCYPITNDSNFKYRYMFFDKMIPAYDTAFFSVTLPFDSKYDQNYYQLGVFGCAVFNRSKSGILNVTLDQQMDNNPVITVKHRSATSSIMTINDINNINIYPNPTQGLIYVNSPNPLNILSTIKVLNFTGKLIDTKELLLTEQTILDYSNLSKGIYFIKIENTKSSFYKKLIIN